MSRSDHRANLLGASSGKPRVLHLIKGLGPGGAERLILNQVTTSEGDFAYSVVYLIKEKDHLVADLERAGATVVRLDGPLPLALRRAIRDLNPAIIHAHSPVLAVAARLLRWRRSNSPRIVTTEHNRWPRHHRVTRTANRLTASLDDSRIAVSQDVRSSMDQRIAATTEVLDHGVPLAEVIAAKSSRIAQRNAILGPENGDIVAIGTVANFRPEKDYDTFLRAAKIALDRMSNLHLIVVGQGPGEAAFRNAAAEFGDRIHVLGFRSDAHHVMAAFDVFTLSSKHEGKPVSLMEAFALGLPVAATLAGGIPEAVTADANGLLVDVGDAEGLADAWLRLASDPELRQRMGMAARAAADGFDAATSTRSIEVLYRSVLTAGTK